MKHENESDMIIKNKRASFQKTWNAIKITKKHQIKENKQIHEFIIKNKDIEERLKMQANMK